MALIPKNLKELKIHLQDPLYRNSYYILLTSGSVSVFGFLFWVIVARLYTPNDVGLATVIFSMSQLISVFSSLGLNYSLVRYYSKRNDKNEMVNTVIFINGIIAFFLSIIFLTGIQFWSPSLIYLQNNYLLLFSFIILTVLSSIFSLQGYVFIAARLAKFSFFQNIVYNILRVPLPFFLLSFGLLGIISSWTLASIIAFLLGSLWLIPKVLPNYKLRPKIELKLLKEIMPFSFGNYIAGVLGSLPFQIMPLLIVNILNVENAAYYYIAWSIAGIFMTISGAVATSLFAEGSQNKVIDFQLNIRKSIIFLFILLIPAIIILFVFSDEILLLFGQTYSAHASTLLWFFIIACIPYAINQIYITIKRVQLEVKTMIYINLATAILILCGSYVLVNMIGLIGVGIAWIFGQGVVAVFVSLFLVKKRSNKFFVFTN